MIEQAPPWAKLMHKEIKSQAVQYGQMNMQLTAFKALINLRLNEHEKAQEFISSRFEDIELQKDHLNRDMDVIRESVEGHPATPLKRGRIRAVFKARMPCPQWR